MQLPVLAAAVAALLAADAHAQSPDPRASRGLTPAACLLAPQAAFRPEAELRDVVEAALGYRVVRIGTEAGCYAVHATDRRGTRYDVRFVGTSLRMVSRHAVREWQ